MMEIVKTRQGNVSHLLKFRHAVDQHLGRGAGVESVADERAAVEIDGCALTGPCFRGGFVFDAGPHFAGAGIDFQDQGRFILVPLLDGILDQGTALPPTQDIQLLHLFGSPGPLAGHRKLIQP